MKKTYLGDGVYAEIEQDGWFVVLTTENGVSVTNRIYMEPSVVRAFEAWLAQVRAEAKP